MFLTLDWEIGYQNGTTVYTYYDSETVHFTVGQVNTPEQPVVEQPIVKPFSYDELSGQIFVTALIGNSNYSESDVVVNASLHIGGHEYEPNTHYVPYQNISCVYSLDGSEWQNMTLVSASKSELFPSIPNNFWYSNMWLNYSATLHDVSEGAHQLRIDVKPDSIRTRNSNSSQGKPLAYFNVIGQPLTAPDSDSLPLLASALVVGTSAIAIAGASRGYWKKRRHIVTF